MLRKISILSAVVLSLACTPGPQGPPGEKGEPGEDGVAGKSSLIRTSSEPVGENCIAGGVSIQTGLDLNGNATLDDEEIQSTSFVCNGGEPTNDCSAAEGTVEITNSLGLESIAGCSEVTGDLTISGLGITSIEPLSALVRVEGTLTIDQNDDLQNLAGLESLTSVAGDLIIWSNDVMTSLDGLSALTNVGGYIVIGNNDILPQCEVDLFTQRLGIDCGNDDGANCNGNNGTSTCD